MIIKKPATANMIKPPNIINIMNTYRLGVRKKKLLLNPY